MGKIVKVGLTQFSVKFDDGDFRRKVPRHVSFCLFNFVHGERLLIWLLFIQKILNMEQFFQEFTKEDYNIFKRNSQPIIDEDENQDKKPPGVVKRKQSEEKQVKKRPKTLNIRPHGTRCFAKFDDGWWYWGVVTGSDHSRGDVLYSVRAI